MVALTISPSSFVHYHSYLSRGQDSDIFDFVSLRFLIKIQVTILITTKSETVTAAHTEPIVMGWIGFSSSVGQDEFRQISPEPSTLV